MLLINKLLLAFYLKRRPLFKVCFLTSFEERLFRRSVRRGSAAFARAVYYAKGGEVIARGNVLLSNEVVEYTILGRNLSLSTDYRISAYDVITKNED